MSAALTTRVGHAEWGDNRFRGFSVARDLAGVETKTSMLVLAITGRRLDATERALLDDLVTVTVVGDPRIWPLKLVRIASCYGRHLPAVAVAHAVFNGARVGNPVTGVAAEVLIQLETEMADISPRGEVTDESAAEEACRNLFADGARPVGFGVPYRRRDERVDMLSERVAARGRSEQRYWRVFKKVTDAVRRIGKPEPNICLCSAAVCLDLGFTPPQIGALIMALASIDVWANAFEGGEQAPACLQLLPSSGVRYVGPAARRSPRATRANTD